MRGEGCSHLLSSFVVPKWISSTTSLFLTGAVSFSKETLSGLEERERWGKEEREKGGKEGRKGEGGEEGREGGRKGGREEGSEGGGVADSL